MSDQRVVRQHAEGSESDGHAIARLVSGGVRFRLWSCRDDRNSGHSLRGVDGDFIEGVSVAFAMREIEANREPLVRADKIHFFDYAVGEPTATLREIRVLANADIFRTKHQLN